jgi:hypothetical protein
MNGHSQGLNVMGKLVANIIVEALQSAGAECYCGASAIASIGPPAHSRKARSGGYQWDTKRRGRSLILTATQITRQRTVKDSLARPEPALLHTQFHRALVVDAFSQQ